MKAHPWFGQQNPSGSLVDFVEVVRPSKFERESPHRQVGYREGESSVGESWEGEDKKK